MKRSEMVNLIENVWKDTTSYPSDKLVAKKILDEIEKAGMLPPPYDSPNDRIYSGMTAPIENKKGWVRNWYWEPENPYSDEEPNRIRIRKTNE